MAYAVPFSVLVDVFDKISSIPVLSNTARHNAKPTKSPQTYLQRFIDAIRGKVPDGTFAALLRLTFPHEDPRRVYGMQNTRLCSAIAKALAINETCLSRENASLGHQVAEELESRAFYNAAKDESQILSVQNLDDLLDELASHSPYTHRSIRSKYKDRRSQSDLIRTIYISLSSPLEAAYTTQIILKDLRPLLYPLPPDAAAHYTNALLRYNSSSVTELTPAVMMNVMDPTRRLSRIYRLNADFNEACEAFERGDSPAPQLYKCIAIPKSVKGRSIQHATSYFSTLDDDLWAETKYDGHRAQVHVQYTDEGPKITIFSKSKRDSTYDRIALHPVIRSAFDNGLEIGRVKNAILDAEMVAFNDDSLEIEEFWRIDPLLDETAYGPRRDMKSQVLETSQISQLTPVSPQTPSSRTKRHLGLIFFDVLLLNSVSLLDTPYNERRKVLETFLKCRKGYAELADRFLVASRGSKTDDRIDALANIFASHVATHKEGLVLKASNSYYPSPLSASSGWLKLKKDYIDSLGDCVDLAICGCDWEGGKSGRAGELRVPNSTFTTFWLGAIVKGSKSVSEDKPHVHMYFKASYGLSREALEEINLLIKGSETVQTKHKMAADKGQLTNKLPYFVTKGHGIEWPRTMLIKPLVAEVLGAGFTKNEGSRYYSLRHPRILKIYRPSSRHYLESCLTLQEMHHIGRESNGRDRPYKDIDDTVSMMFDPYAALSPKAKNDKAKRDRTVDHILSAVGAKRRACDDLHLSDNRRPKRLKEVELSSRMPLVEMTTKSQNKEVPPLRALQSIERDGVLNTASVLDAGVKTGGAESLATPPPSNPAMSRNSLLQTPGKGRQLKLAYEGDNSSKAVSTTLESLNENRLPTPKSPSRSSENRASGSTTTPGKPISWTVTRDIRVEHPGGDLSDKISFSTLLHTCFVWTKSAIPRSFSDTLFQTILQNQIHSIESFLIACRWDTSVTALFSSSIQGGIILSGRSKKSQEKLCETLKLLESVPVNVSASEPRKPIWVFMLNRSSSSAEHNREWTDDDFFPLICIR